MSKSNSLVVLDSIMNTENSSSELRSGSTDLSDIQKVFVSQLFRDQKQSNTDTVYHMIDDELYNCLKTNQIE